MRLPPPWPLFLLALAVFTFPAFTAEPEKPSTVVVYPAPEGAPASGDYTLEVNGKPVFVYTANVLKGGPASFAYFDFSGTATIKATSKRAIQTVAIRPASYGMKHAVDGNAVTFSISEPRNLSVEVNGGGQPLLVFANPLEHNPPKKGDPNVIYFGPGIHEVGGTTKMPSNTTVYIAGGAIVRGKLLPEEKPVQERNWAGNKEYQHLFVAENAENVTVRGRGIVDGSLLPWHAKCPFLFTNCKNFLVEGIIVTDSPGWNMPCFGCQGGQYLRVRQIAHRENSDGINICNSQDILVDGCFLRNNDDEICIKTPSPPPALESKNITVKNCIIWNDRALGIGITYETRTNVTNALFKDCDIIHDSGIGAIAIHVSDSGTMSQLLYENIRVEETQRLFRLWIGADMWGHDKKRGHIRGVTFKNITYTGGGTPGSELTGADAGHLVEDITFDHLRLNGKLIRNAGAGNMALRNTANVRFITADAPPKQAPKITGAKSVSDSRVDLAWEAVADPDPEGEGLSYAVYRDNAKIGVVAAAVFSDTGVREKTTYTYCVSAINGSMQEGPKSEAVKATTPPDTTPPFLYSVWALTGEKPLVGVTFNEDVEQTSANQADNYAIDNGVAVKNAALSSAKNTVLLAVDKLLADVKYTLSVSNVRDMAAKPNTIAPNSSKSFSFDPGLAAHWTLSEGSGTKVADCSAENNHGEVRGQPAWVSGPEGRGLKVQPDTYVEVPHSASLEKIQEGSYTLCARFTPLSVPAGTGDANNAAYGILMKAGYHLGLTYAHDKKFAMNHWLQGDQGAGAASAGTFEPGKSCHVAGVVDRAAGIVRLYVNGKLEGEGRFNANAIARAYGDTPWRLGIANPDAPTYRWPAHGIFGGAQIYRTALTEAQVRALAEGGK